MNAIEARLAARSGSVAAVVRGVPLELVLSAAVSATLAFEAAKGAEPLRTAPIWLVLQCAVTALALAVALVRRDELRLPVVLALGSLLALGSIAIHLALGMESDWDSREVYGPQGEVLLSGHYPRSEYPPGAVLLFAFEALIGGESARVSNAFVMVPFQLLTVAAVWALRTPFAAWLAALVALWPLNAFHWEFRFDSVPTALTALGVLAAFRGRWTLAGAFLGAGAAVKWTPGLVAIGLAVWLLASGRRADALRHATAAAATFVAVHVPFLLANASAVLAAYTTQGGREITGESLPYLPLRVLGLARPGESVWDPADVPSWATSAAVGVQAAGVLALLATIVVVRGNHRAGIALATLLPVVFLLTNRIFSPQFIVPLFVSWAIAAALLERRSRGAATVALLAAFASLCNALIYPGVAGTWAILSTGLFAASLAATGWLIARALAAARPLARAS
jgi:hypothetical protein